MSEAQRAIQSRRFSVFIVVGWLGFVLQLTALALLMSLAHWSWLTATVVAVELAVVHNFIWHERVTWRDRPRVGVAGVARFVRFNMATGLMSIGGNVALMAIYVGVIGLPPIVGNALAVATMSAVSFVVADRWVFQHVARPAVPRILCVIVVLCIGPATASAGPRSEAVQAWNRYVADVEARVERTHAAVRNAPADREIRAEGESIGVPSGTISRWSGSVFIAGARLDDVLERLQYPGTPPPQEDVVWSRVIARAPDSLRVFIRLVRHAIVTVTYDTEHEMTFRRRTPTLATARSVATRIEEMGGADRGFLWRLNSYWRYEQVKGGVRVDLESLTLSRGVPAVIRPIASPIVSSIARESTVRTLEALSRYLSPTTAHREDTN